MRRVFSAALLATLAAGLAGCGGGSANDLSVRLQSGASSSAPMSLAFVAIDSDLGSSQWQQLDELSKKFPGRDKALSQLRQELAENGVDYEQDVKPALGPEVDVALAAGRARSRPRLLG